MVLTNLTAMGSYQVRVRAINSAGLEGAYSSPILFTALYHPSAPLSLQASSFNREKSMD